MNLTKDPIPKLIKKIAIPATVGFFFNTMYNVVDTFYAGLISTETLAALSLSFPIFFIILAFGMGISQGATALIANSLGKKDIKDARFLAIQSVSFAFIFSVFLTVLGLVISPWLFQILGASGTYLETSLSYMNIIFLGVIFFLLQFSLNASLTSQGDTKTFRNVLIIGFFLNLILDPWFMYGGFGIPPMGVSGIALATIVIEVLGAIYLYYVVSKTDLWKNWMFKNLKPNFNKYKEIAHQGFPASINMMTVAAGIFIITFFLSKFGQSAVAAYGIATRIEQIVLIPTIGFNIAVLSLVGQNNGAKLYNRVREAYNISIKYGFYMIIASTAILLLFSKSLMGIFTDDQEVINIGSQYLFIAAFTLFSYILLFITTSLLQGLKKPMFAIWLGISRQLVLPIIIFWILAIFLDLRLIGIWLGIFIINWSSAIFTYFYGQHKLKQVSQDK